MEEVEAVDVKAAAQQVAHRGFGRAGGTDAADDFGGYGRGMVRGRDLLGMMRACFQWHPREVLDFGCLLSLRC